MLVKLGKLRVRLDTIARYTSGYYLCGINKDNSYMYSEGVEVVFTDGKTQTLQLSIAEADSILLGRT